MTADRIETDTACRALAHRLNDWGVPEPASKARAFVDDLIARGWKPRFDLPTRRPPMASEECRQHRGEYAPPNCRCCAADKKAAREEVAAEASEQQRLARADAIAAARASIRRVAAANEESEK